MEKKNYPETFQKIKEEILSEICELVPQDSSHHFSRKIYFYRLYETNVTTQICHSVDVWQNGMVSFILRDERTSVLTEVHGDGLDEYAVESLSEVLLQLRTDVRQKKLARLREIVQKNGYSMKFDNTSNFIIQKNIEDFDSKLEGLRLVGTKLKIDNVCAGNHYTNSESDLSDNQLDKLIAYAESHSKQQFVIQVSGSFSRTFNIQASTYEEALEEAKDEWENTPLYFEDSNGEFWSNLTDCKG